MSVCTDCSKVFNSPSALHKHCRDKSDHAYCEECERLFVHFQALNQHLQNSSVHRDESSESECSEEPEYESFESECSEEPEYESSEEDSDEEEDRHCDSCNRWFGSNASLLQHLAASSSHNWCFICSRDFRSESALEQHNSSRVHHPSNILCPICQRAFKVPSAIALHIESGGCHNKIDRHNVTAAVHALNLTPTISISRRIHGPVGGVQPIVTYSATERAFNGSSYECYLCHRTFRTLSSLNTHLGSAAHDKDEFRCPARKCGVRFKLISGLIQHIESEACGIARFQEVEDYATELTDRFSKMLKI